MSMLTPSEAKAIAGAAMERRMVELASKEAERRCRLEVQPEFAAAMAADPELEFALGEVRRAAESGKVRHVHVRFSSDEGRPPQVHVHASVYGRALRCAQAMRAAGWDCELPGLPYAPHDQDGHFGASCSFEVRF